MTRINIFETDEASGERTLAGWFDLKRAERTEGRREWDGNNQADVHVGANRGQNLIRTAGGRWVIEQWSAWVSEEDTYEFVTDEQARTWLLVNESDELIEKWFGEVEEEKGPGRPEVGPAFSVRFPADLLAWVDRRANEDGVTRAALLREATVRYLNEMDSRPNT